MLNNWWNQSKELKEQYTKHALFPIPLISLATTHEYKNMYNNCIHDSACIQDFIIISLLFYIDTLFVCFLKIESLYLHVWLCYRITDVNIFYLNIDISFYDSHSLQVPLIKCLWFFEIFHIKKIITHSLINKYFIIHIQYACNHMYIQQKYLESKRYAIQWDKNIFWFFISM